MNNVFLHHTYKTNHLIKIMLSILILFFIHGLYKNGLSLFFKGYGNFYIFLKPILFLLLSIIISYLNARIFKKDLISWQNLCNIIISLIVMPNTNIFLYLIILIGVNILANYVKINSAALYMIILIMIYYFMNNYTFLNSYEQSVEHHLVFFDYIMGYGSSGIGNSLLFLSLVSFLVLLASYEYKKDIPLMAFLSFYILLIIKTIFTGHINLDTFLNNNVIFAIIFIAPLSIYSPYTKGAEYLYGLFLGLITFIFSFIDLTFGVYFGIALLSLFNNYFDKFIISK